MNYLFVFILSREFPRRSVYLEAKTDTITLLSISSSKLPITHIDDVRSLPLSLEVDLNRFSKEDGDWPADGSTVCSSLASLITAGT